MSKVEDFFITPLEAHFEAIPKDGPRDTIITDLDAYAPDDLMEAAEWLKRARQAQTTFPSPKECIKAIKAVVGGRSLVQTGGMNAITNQTYGAAAAAYAKNQYKDRAPVIAEGSAEWGEWIAYYEWIGMGRWIFAEMRERKKWTVPSYFPSQFDPRFNQTKRAAA